MPEKPTILTLVSHYLPGVKAGGPMRTIANVVTKLSDEFLFKIVTSDRDLGDYAPYPGVRTNRWTTVGNAEVFYATSGNPLSVLRMIRCTPHDVLYINSFFGRAFSIIPLMAASAGVLPNRPIILAPRGEFSTGALMNKPGRKKQFVNLARKLPVYWRAVWQASSDFEASDILREFLPADRDWAVVSGRKTASVDRTITVVSAPDLLCAPRDYRRHMRHKASGALRLVFLSRISRKKNLTAAIQMLRDLRGQVEFDVYGPIENISYWGQCQELIQDLPSNIQVQYRGTIEHEQVHATLSGYDLFLFPTLGENFGHVIGEALLAGCPVLTSDTTAWRGLESTGVGWDLPLAGTARFTEVLQKCVDMGDEEHASMCARAACLGENRVNEPATIEQSRALFRLALEPPAVRIRALGRRFIKSQS